MNHQYPTQLKQTTEVTRYRKSTQDNRYITLQSNLFPLTLPRGIVYHYDVNMKIISTHTSDEKREYTQTCTDAALAREVIARLAKALEKKFDIGLLGYDGRKNLYARRALPFEYHIFQVYHKINEEENDRTEFIVKVKFVKRVDFDRLHAMYEQNGTKGMFQDEIATSNIILRTESALSLKTVGRSFFTNQGAEAQNLNFGREGWEGFSSSIRLGQSQPLLNINLSGTTFYKSIKLSEFVREVLGDRALQKGLNSRERVILQEELAGLQITHTHSGNHSRWRRRYLIKGVSHRGANVETFERNGTPVTVADYFKTNYESLKFPNLQCIIEPKGNKLPMEVCVLVAGQRCRRNLWATQGQAPPICSTTARPGARFGKIIKSAEAIRDRAIRLNEFDMQINPAPMQVSARVLPTPNQAHLQHDEAGQCAPADKMYLLQRWALVFHAEVSDADVDRTIAVLMQECRKLGITPSYPVFVDKFRPTSSEVAMLQTVKNEVKDTVDITVVVMGPTTRYPVLKMWAETSELAMRTQCIKLENVRGKFWSISKNLLLQIHAKCGGCNLWSPNLVAPQWLEQRVLFVGADVNHPAPGDTKTPSIAAIVASLDFPPTQYYATTETQKSPDKNRVEYILHLKKMFIECLNAFCPKPGNKLPKAIYFFRDGVSECQLAAVREHELRDLRQAWLAKFPTHKLPQITFIVVQKRHHVRFRPQNERDGVGANKNIPPGTVVDRDVVHPMLNDFYLTSHYSPVGTARPAHYHVVHDDAGHSLQRIEELSYYLCHMYARSSKSVSIPAPVYYAHLAAARAKDHIRASLELGHISNDEEYAAAQQVHQKLKGRMYFI